MVPMKTWHAFALLIITAVAIHYLWPFRHLIILIGIGIVALNAWLWLCRRFPRTAWFLYGFARGLGGR